MLKRKVDMKLVRKHFLKLINSYHLMKSLHLKGTLSEENKKNYDNLESILAKLSPIEAEIIRFKYMGSAIREDIDIYKSLYISKMNYKKYVKFEQNAILNFSKEAIKLN